MYTEDKFEAEEDMRERAARLVQSGHARDASDGEVALEELLRTARNTGPEMYEKVALLVGQCSAVVGGEGDRCVADFSAVRMRPMHM